MSRGVPAWCFSTFSDGRGEQNVGFPSIPASVPPSTLETLFAILHGEDVDGEDVDKDKDKADAEEEESLESHMEIDDEEMSVTVGSSKGRVHPTHSLAMTAPKVSKAAGFGNRQNRRRHLLKKRLVSVRLAQSLAPSFVAVESSMCAVETSMCFVKMETDTSLSQLFCSL